MVDCKKTELPTKAPGEGSKINNFINRAPGIGVLKNKFLNVIGSSNELLNGISNRLTLSSSSSDADCLNDDDEVVPKFDETIDYTKIDFESRRVKARRAHEEIISGRFRYPNLAPISSYKDEEKGRSDGSGKIERPTSSVKQQMREHHSSSSSSTSDSQSSSSSSPFFLNDRTNISSTTRSNSIESRHSGGYDRSAIPGARRSELDIQKDMQRFTEVLTNNVEGHLIDLQSPADSNKLNPLEANNALSVTGASGSAIGKGHMRSKTPNSSTLTSLRDNTESFPSLSVESSDWKNFIRSESQNSMPSWASSISLDCRTGEEPIKDFMKNFTDLLFTRPPSIEFELKAQYGNLIRLQLGRQWFTRFVIEHKNLAKRVSELTFHSLVQYFSILLNECSEFEDFSPAAVIMKLCFLFYHEIEVPGCDAYREYLFLFMRQQPLWQSLKFWNSSFLETLKIQLERRQRLYLKRVEKQKLRDHNKTIMASTADSIYLNKSMFKTKTDSISNPSTSQQYQLQQQQQQQQGTMSSGESFLSPVSASTLEGEVLFKLLGVFTCNMHALGVSRELSLEFLKLQMSSLNMTKVICVEKLSLIKDNIHRMYHETDLWGSTDS